MFMVRSLFLLLFTLTSGISRVSAKTSKEEVKFIKSFALVVLQQLKLLNTAVLWKYFMNVIYWIWLLMFEQDYARFCFVNIGQSSFLFWNPSLLLNTLCRSFPFSLQLFLCFIILLLCSVTPVSKTKMAIKSVLIVLMTV